VILVAFEAPAVATRRDPAARPARPSPARTPGSSRRRSSPMTLGIRRQSLGALGSLAPTMKENPGSPSAFRLAADSIPASATTMSATRDGTGTLRHRDHGRAWSGRSFPGSAGTSVESPLVGRRGLGTLLKRPGDLATVDRDAVAVYLDRRFVLASHVPLRLPGKRRDWMIWMKRDAPSAERVCGHRSPPTRTALPNKIKLFSNVGPRWIR